MKTRIALILLLLCTSVALARNIIYNHKRPPRLALGAAYDRAIVALGDSSKLFHCTGAQLAISFSQDGEWLFSFSSPDGTPKYVTVEFDGETHVEDRIVR